MLVNLLKDEAAPVYVLRLWSHCQLRRQDTFENLPVEALKALCRFPGHANLLESSLVASGFVRRDSDGSLSVVNWREYNAKIVSSWSNGAKGGKRPRDNPTGTQDEIGLTQEEPNSELGSSEKRGIDGIREEKTGEEIPPNPLSGGGGGDPQKRKTKFDPADIPIPESLDSPEFREAWAVWIRSRAELRKPLTETAATLQMTKLAAWGRERGIAALTVSAANGWTGLYEAREGRSTGGRSDDPRGNKALVERHLNRGRN